MKTKVCFPKMRERHTFCQVNVFDDGASLTCETTATRRRPNGDAVGAASCCCDVQEGEDGWKSCPGISISVSLHHRTRPTLTLRQFQDSFDLRACSLSFTRKSQIKTAIPVCHGHLDLAVWPEAPQDGLSILVHLASSSSDSKT